MYVRAGLSPPLFRRTGMARARPELNLRSLGLTELQDTRQSRAGILLHLLHRGGQPR